MGQSGCKNRIDDKTEAQHVLYSSCYLYYKIDAVMILSENNCPLLNVFRPHLSANWRHFLYVLRKSYIIPLLHELKKTTQKLQKCLIPSLVFLKLILHPLLTKSHDAMM